MHVFLCTSLYAVCVCTVCVKYNCVYTTKYTSTHTTQAGMLGVNSPTLPLWSVLATKHILRWVYRSFLNSTVYMYIVICSVYLCSTYSHVEDPLQLDEVIESFENYQVSTDWYVKVGECRGRDWR